MTTADFEAFVDSLPSPTLIVDHQRQYCAANHLFYQITGLTPDQLLRRPVNQVFSELDWQPAATPHFQPLYLHDNPLPNPLEVHVGQMVLSACPEPYWILTIRLAGDGITSAAGRHVIKANATGPLRDALRSQVDAAFLRQVAAHLPDMGILVFDHELRFLFAEGPALNSVGYPSDNVEGRTIFEVIDETVVGHLLPSYQRVLAGESFSFEYHSERLDRYYNIDFLPILEEDGQVAAGMIVNQEITALKQEQNALAEREAQLRSIMHNFPSGAITLFDQDLRYLIVDGLGLADVGLSAEEMTGKTIFELFPPETTDQIEPFYRDALSGKSSEVNIPFANRLYLQRAYPVKNEQGEIIAGAIVTQDITEMERMSELLSETSRIAKLGGWEFDLETKAQLLSEEIYRIYELEPGSRVSFETGVNFYHPEDRSTMLKAFKGLVENGRPYDLELRFISATGTHRWVRTTGNAVFENGRVVRTYGILQDITTRKSAELAVVKLNETLHERAIHLQSMNQELESFAYSVSHDLRAPLRAIDGFSLALLEDYEAVLDETGRDFLNRVRGAATRMASLIDALLSLSRIARQPLKKSAVDLSNLVTQISARIAEEMPERQVKWVIEPQVKVKGDERLLEIAFTNLLQNAWKFTGKTPQPQIEFGVTQQNDIQELFVRDNGIGFDMKYVNKLFTPFQRLHRFDQFPGTGIGLATVQRVINRHGGTIRVESQPNIGTTFFIQM